jgi:hypothetical protein
MTEPQEPGADSQPTGNPERPWAAGMSGAPGAPGEPSEPATPHAPTSADDPTTPDASQPGWLAAGAPPESAGPQPETPKRKGFGRVGYLLAGIVGVGAFAIWKFVVPLVLVGVAGQVFGSAFGGPYNRLPSDVRAGFEQRFEAAVGADFDDQTDAEQEARITALVKGGMPRLPDGLIDTNFRLSVKGMQTVNQAACTAIARSFFTGGEPPDDAATALIDTLSDTELQQWFEIRVQAVEAESRGTPPAVLISDAAVDPLYEKVFLAMHQEDVDTFIQMANGTTVEDAKLCAAARGLYGSVLTLSPGEVLTFARYDVTP